MRLSANLAAGGVLKEGSRQLATSNSGHNKPVLLGCERHAPIADLQLTANLPAAPEPGAVRNSQKFLL
jgi:hypothetical protein